MGRRRGRCEAKEVDAAIEAEKRAANRNSDEEADEADLVKGFFACYLLCSLSPRHKGRTYIGFTVNPGRRIKQHNGEKRCGAWRTKRGRPWEMILCIYGFPSNVSALQFEWAWQHPVESLAVRNAASSFKSLSGIANKIKLAYTMLNLPSWENLNLTVNFFSTKYTKFVAGCPRLPYQMRFNICSMDDLPCYNGGVQSLSFKDDDFDEDDRQVDKNNKGLNLEEMNINISPIENIDSYNSLKCLEPANCTYDQPLQNLSEFTKPIEECYGDLSYSSGVLLELNEFNDHSQSPETVNECRRRASISLSPSSCSKDGVMKPASQKSTPTSFFSKAMTDNSLLLSPEVDVINLCTPSSSIARSKTKRALFDSVIIDLTDSPTIIQL